MIGAPSLAPVPRDVTKVLKGEGECFRMRIVDVLLWTFFSTPDTKCCGGYDVFGITSVQMTSVFLGRPGPTMCGSYCTQLILEWFCFSQYSATKHGFKAMG